MICSLSKDDKNYSVYLNLYKHLTAELNRIANTPDATINVAELMRKMYKDVYAKKKDHELAVRFARMIPTVVLNIAVKDTSMILPLMKSGLDMNYTATMAGLSMDPVNGIDYIEKEIGITKDIFKEIKDLQEGEAPNPGSSEPKPPVNSLPGAGAPGNQLSFTFDDEGNVELEEVEDEDEEGGNDVNRIFEAVAPHVFKDTDNEAISMDKDHSMYNVVDPAKKMFYTVKRNIVRLLRAASGTGSSINYPGVGKLFLRAQSSSLIPKEMTTDKTTPVVLVVVDENGKTVLFNDKGEVTPDGKPSFYNLRSPFKIKAKYEQERIVAVQNSFGVSREIAEKVVLKERKVVEDIIDYIGKDVNNSVTMDITGGTLGHLASNPAPYYISNVAFGSDVFNPIFGNDGKYHFSLPSVSEQPIRISQSSIKDRPELIDLLSNWLTEDIYDRAGVKIKNSKKKEVLQRYMVVDSRRLTVVSEGVKVNGKVYDTSTPEARAIAKQAIKEYLSNLIPYKVLTEAETKARVKKGSKIVTSIKDAKFGDILQTNDEETGEPIYQLMVNVTLNITQEGLDTDVHIKLTDNPEQGGMSVEYVKGGYRENYIKENFQIDKLINGENQLVALNAYLTFQPLAYETGKIDNITEEETNKEIDDAEIERLELTAKEAAEYEALPAELKEAMAIHEQAMAIAVPGTSLQTAVLDAFKNNLRAGLYDRQFAELVLNELYKQYKFSFEFKQAGSTLIRMYTKYAKIEPRQSWGPELEAKRKELQSIYTNVFKITKHSDELPSLKRAFDALVDFNNRYPLKESPAQNAIEIKKGVLDLFENNPELFEIGTPEQYSEWINYLITQGSLANTKATEIVYHGSPTYFEEFDKARLGTNTGAASAKEGIFFGGSRDVSRSYLARRSETPDVKKYVELRYGSEDKLEEEATAIKLSLNYDDGDFDFFTILHNGQILEDIEGYGQELIGETIDSPSTLARLKRAGYTQEKIDTLKKSLDIKKKADADFYANYLKRQNELKSTYDTDAGTYIDVDRSITEKPFEHLFLRPFLINVSNPLVTSDNGNQYREETYYQRIVNAKENNNDGVIIEDTYDSRHQTQPENVYVVFDVDQIYELGSKKDKEGFSNFIKKPSSKIDETDRIIWGHPGLGKSFLRESRSDIIDFDTDYKSRINEKYNLKPGFEARNEWRKSNEDLWNENVRQLWREAKAEAKRTGKFLLASDMILLREFAGDFNKVVTMSDETFINRSKQRNDYTQGKTEDWKGKLNVEVGKMPADKVIHTDKYLSDILPKPSVIQPTINKQGKVNIYDGTKENAHLSNFAERPFVYNGITFPTVEHAFQYAKGAYYNESSIDPSSNDTPADRRKLVEKHLEKILNAKTAAEAKRLGKKNIGVDFENEFWDEESEAIMKALITESFKQNPEALENLLATGTLELTHTQDKSNWGKLFPKVLTEVRRELALDKLNQLNAKLASTIGGTTKPAMNIEIEDPLNQPDAPDSTLDKKTKRGGRKANRGKIYNANKDDLTGKRPEDDDELHFKMVAQKSDNPKVTEEQIKEAKKWYESSPISKHVSFREMFDVVNSQNPDSVANWSTNGIMLYKGSDFTDLYHEAFHAFSQAFMTEEQRDELYNEVRKKKGSFKTYEGKIVDFASAKDKEVEEWLAEDFRSYMLTNRKKKTGEPKRNTFFEKLVNILEMIFGDLTPQEVISNDRANDKIIEIYEKLRVGNLDGYNFNKANVKFNSLDKGVQATNESDNLMNLSDKDTKLLMDSIDAWVAQVIDAANAGLSQDKFDEFRQMQIDLFLGKITPEEMETAKLVMAPKMTYSQTATFLKSKQGREMAYKIVQQNLINLVNALADEEAAESNPVKKQELRKKHGLAYWAYFNFGDVNNITNNRPDKDGTIRGVIAYHMANSQEFGTKAIDLLDKVDDNADEEQTSRSAYAEKSGNETSLKDLAKSEVAYLFKTLLKYDPVTGQPLLNELGAPMLMDAGDVMNRVAIILENERDAIKMYHKLLAEAQNPDATEMTYAFRQLVNKLGPRGLDPAVFPHTSNKAAQNLWTNFWAVFNTRRISLQAMSVDIQLDKSGNKERVESRIGRGINAYAKIGKEWNSLFKWNRDNPYVIFDEDMQVPYLDLDKVIKEFKSYENIVENDRVFEFLHAIGIQLTENENTRRILKEGDPELGIRGDYQVVRTLFQKSIYRLNQDKKSKAALLKMDINRVDRMSLMQSMRESGIYITQPQDLFKPFDMDIVGGYYIADGKSVPIMMSGLAGESSNWNELLALEGYHGEGNVSFMVTTASGTTQFEHTLNSTMTVKVSSINDARDYQHLISMPHMARYDVSKNPNAKRYVWLNNMFVLDVDPSDSRYGQRRVVKDRVVKLDLFNISGAKKEGKDGVSSSSADPFTKFILDLHLNTQKFLPELMRHSDKGTSYSVVLNFLTSPDTQEVLRGMYMTNTDFLDPRAAFHARAFYNYILPNIISEQFRVRKMIEKKAEIDNTLKKIEKERKAGKQITPTPVFDFNYLKNGQKFQAFAGVLNSNTKDKLAKIENLEDLLLGKGKDSEEAKDLMKALIGETQDYFNKQYNEVKHLFDKGGLIADNLVSQVIAEYQDKKIPGEIDPTPGQVTDAVLNSYVYNSWIHNIESMNFLYGDIAMYNHMKEEFHKRNAGIASTGTFYRTDQDMLNHVNNVLGRGFEYSLTGKTRIYDGTMNTGVMKDKITRSAYLEEIAFNLFNQMKEKAMRNSKQSGKTEEEIDMSVKMQLFGRTNVNVSSVEALEGLVPEDKSIMHAYYAMNEADAQGWISFDSYRILMDSQGEWSPAQEAMYQAMLAGKEIPGDKIGTFFPPIKAQYWGELKSDDTTGNEQFLAFHKFQLTPIVPTLAIPGSKLGDLHNKMMNQGVDYVLFESGSKISTLTTVQFDDKGKAIRDKDGDISSIKDDIYNNDRDITDNPFTINTIYVDYLKNQLKIEPKFKKKVTFPTQIRKLIEVDLMENGIPVDFMRDDELEDRIDRWFELNEDEKLEASNNYRQVREYENAVMRLTMVKKRQLLLRANLETNADGSVRGDLAGIIKFVKSQLTNQDLADHEIDFIDINERTGKVKTDLSFSLSADKIEKLLNALVVKSLVRQSVNGESLIQVSGAMLEEKGKWKLPTKEQLAKHGTNGLTYYRINKEKGIIDAMKIKIAMQGDFEKLLYLPDVMVTKHKTDKDGNVLTRKGKPIQELDYNASLKKLNDLLKDEAWLDKGENRSLVTLHGDRIPIQGLNSDEFAEVYEFLPKEEGNIIILPSEIVAKSGGDFDIDKLTLLMPNISLRKTKDAKGDDTHQVSLTKILSRREYSELYRSYLQGLVNDYHNNADKLVKADMGENFDVYNIDEEDDDEVKRIKKAEAVLKHYSLFGGQESVDSFVAEMLVEEGLALSEEEFMLKDAEKAAQNDVLFAMNNLSRNIANYSNLVRPNATDIFDPIVEDLKKVYRDYTPKISTNDEDPAKKGIQPTRVFEVAYNLYKHMSNNFGKKALGIGAIDNTYNELFNRVGLYLTPNNREMMKGKESDDMQAAYDIALHYYNLKSKFEEIRKDNQNKPKNEQYVITKEEWKEFNNAKAAYNNVKDEVEGFVRQTLYLPHNTMRVKDGEGKPYRDKAISMSHIMDAYGENKIGDVISQLMNGWVDVAKEPWVFYVRGDDKLGPILLFLVQAGVPIRHAAYMLSQPAIVDYMETIAKLQSEFAEGITDQNVTEEEVEKITRDKAVLRAKEVMLEKLGYEFKGKGMHRINDIQRTIAEESIYAFANVLNDEGQFSLEDLAEQAEYAYNKYKVFDSKTGQPNTSNTNVNYEDEQLNEFQKAIFLHFLQIVDMEAAVKDIKLRTNVDTTKSGSLYEAENKILQLQELKRARLDSKSQGKYWRIPPKVIDRMIPTIKDAQGDDTGKLDMTKAGSVLSGFYIQPFQLEIWKDLFPLRNNSSINAFLTDLGFAAKDYGKNNTYLTTDDKLLGEFKSALIPMIFQNAFLGFDIHEKIKEANAKGEQNIYFRGAEVKLSPVIALDMGALVKYEPITENGVTKMKPVLYYDYEALYKQFKESSYATADYRKLGLAKVDAAAFKSFPEYVKFVFERECLRAQFVSIGTKKSVRDLNELYASAEFKDFRSDAIRDMPRKKKEDGTFAETVNEWNKRVNRVAFERYLRSKALQNAYNMHAMFNGDTAFAYEVSRIKIDKRFAGLVEKFPVLKNLVPDSEQNRSSDKQRVNLAFMDAPTDSQVIGSYYEQLQDLANEISLQQAMPNLTRDEIDEIATVFRKLPIVAFLQSGMSTVGRFSLTRIIDQDTILNMTQGPVKEFLDKIDNEKQAGNYNSLRNLWDTFIAANKIYDARGKNYVVQTDGKGNNVSDIRNAMFLETDEDVDGVSRVYDPSFINDQGIPIQEYVRVGDTITVIRSANNVDQKPTPVMVDSVSWEDGRVVIMVTNPATSTSFGFKYTSDGTLAEYIKSDGSIQKKPTNVRTSAGITKELLAELRGDEVNELTRPGDIVDIISNFAYKVEVIDIQDLGYETVLVDGAYRYTDTQRFYVKIKTQASGAEATYVVDQTGKVLAKMDDKGYFRDWKHDMRIDIVTPKNRVQGNYIASNVEDMKFWIANGMLPPGSIVDVMGFNEKLGHKQSQLMIYDPSSLAILPLGVEYKETEAAKPTVDEDKEFFLIYNGAVTPRGNIAQERTSTTADPEGKGKIDLRDRFIHHGAYNNKVGIISRLAYGGGKNAEFIKDDVDPETGKATVNPIIKELIDRGIAEIKVKMAQGYAPRFSKSGYGQYMIGANDTTNEIIGDPVAKETFIYLSTQLLENFGYINPNFIQKAGGMKEIVRVTKQPVSDEQYQDMMNKCFNLK